MLNCALYKARFFIVERRIVIFSVHVLLMPLCDCLAGHCFFGKISSIST